MGDHLARFKVKPEESEQIEVRFKLPKEERSVIHGIVIDHYHRPIKDAVVKLFQVVGSFSSCRLKALTHAFTDECGEFLFGPLLPFREYVVKVWYDNVKMKQIYVNCEEGMNIEVTENPEEQSIVLEEEQEKEN